MASESSTATETPSTWAMRKPKGNLPVTCPRLRFNRMVDLSFSMRSALFAARLVGILLKPFSVLMLQLCLSLILVARFCASAQQILHFLIHVEVRHDGDEPLRGVARIGVREFLASAFCVQCLEFLDTLDVRPWYPSCWFKVSWLICHTREEFECPDKPHLP